MRCSRWSAALLVTSAAAALSACSMNLTPPSAPPTSVAPSPTAAVSRAPVSSHFAGTGPGDIVIENPFYPLQEGRESLTATTSFTCSGEAPFDVAWAPGTGTSFGATTCGGGTGSSNIPIGRSLQQYTVTVTVDAGVDWTLDVLLAPPKTR